METTPHAPIEWQVLFGDLDYLLNASRGFVSWASCFNFYLCIRL